MREIQLTKGKVALVDDEDYDAVSAHKWYVGGNERALYAKRDGIVDGKRVCIFMHRMISNAPKGMCVDHLNGNGLDNRRENLRVCTSAENHRNIRKTRGRSKFKGVCFHKARNRWQAFIQIDRKTVFLGLFDDQREAALAYDSAARDYHGDFACTNADLGLL